MKQLQFNSLSSLVFCFLVALLLQFATGCQEKIAFEKLIAHSTTCFGDCPAYHIEIHADRSIKLYSEHVWSTEKEGKEDWSKMGYFIGILPDTTYSRMVSLVNTAIESSDVWGPELYHDLPHRELIVYHDNKRTAMAAMKPPLTAHPLLKLFSDMCQNHNFSRTPDPFYLEHDTALWQFYYLGPSEAHELYLMP